ncbi:MAG TPA: hypothetical protein VF646_01860 [Cytophagales bacterium]|jgi:hypothetical protein
MATGENRSAKNDASYTKAAPSSSRIPANASAEQAAQLLGYGVGDTVMLGDTVTSNLTSGGTSAGNTPNSTDGPAMLTGDTPIANVNAGYNSGNSARTPDDSHQATLSNAAEGQQLLVSRYDDVKGLFFAYKLNPDGTHDRTEVPLGPDENYRRVAGPQAGTDGAQ